MRALIAFLWAFVAGQACAAQDVVLRHGMEGAALDALATLVIRFNDEQNGKARVVLEHVADVVELQRLPHMALLDDDDARLFFNSRPRYLLPADVLKAAGLSFDQTEFFPQVADAVEDVRGRLQALPMALSLPVLFYNKDAFARAGLDPESPPKTWREVQAAAARLAEAGFRCPLTSSRFARVHLENVGAQHGEPVVLGNGRFAFNNMVEVKHLALLASWQKSAYFHYFGPGREGDTKFTLGECAMLTGESGLLADIRGRLRFPVGVAELPHYEDVWGVKPDNVLPDGAALWILPGKKKDDYAVVARFIAFLMRPDVQQEWVRATGFLPMTPAALDALAASGTSPRLVEAARARLSIPGQKDARARAGATRSRLRAILAEEVEFVWRNVKPAKLALDTAMIRARALPKN